MAHISVSRPPLPRVAAVLALAGNSTFGGGTATIVEIERHLIDRHGWFLRSDSHLAYAISRLTPGTNLLAYVVAVGWRMRGAMGAVVALMAVSVPGAALAVVLTAFVAGWAEHPLTAPALNAVLAAAVAIMAGTSWTMVRPYIEQRAYLRTFLFAGSGLLVALTGALSPFQVLLVALVAGALWPEGPRT
jgi:chromate transporter